MKLARAVLTSAFFGFCCGLTPNAYAGVPDGNVDCSMVPPEGECQGNVLVYCDEQAQAYTFDCSEVPGAMCTTISEDWGYDCAVAEGETCFDGDAGPVLCLGGDSACVIRGDQGLCETNIPPCDESEIGSCNGDELMADCYAGQALVIDCAAFGASSCAQGACVDLPEGSDCDGEVLLCAGGLTCNADGWCEGASSQPPPPPGPMGSTDAGMSGGAPDSGMSSNPNPNPPVSSPDAGTSTPNNPSPPAPRVMEEPDRDRTDTADNGNTVGTSSCAAVADSDASAWLALAGSLLLVGAGKRRRRRE
jgi:hypothetical protein